MRASIIANLKTMKWQAKKDSWIGVSLYPNEIGQGKFLVLIKFKLSKMRYIDSCTTYPHVNVHMWISRC